MKVLSDDVTSDVKKPGSTIHVDRLDALCYAVDDYVKIRSNCDKN